MSSLGHPAIAALSGASLPDRYLDLGVSLREHRDSNVEILRVGGRWDLHEAKWAGDAKELVVIRAEPSQYEIFYWFCEWLKHYGTGSKVKERPGEWRNISVITAEGGRGGGKSDFGVAALILFNIAFRDRITWALSPTQDQTEELRAATAAKVPIAAKRPLPGKWGVWLEDDATFYWWTGGVTRMLSGFKPSALKQGRVDMWLLNEAQLIQKKAYIMARPRLADTSGLGVMTLNPPDTIRGLWVTKFHQKAHEGKYPDVKPFTLDARQNSRIDWGSLELLRESFGDEDYRREILGEFVPIGDRVFYAWDDEDSVRPAPELGHITRAVTKQVLGKEFDFVLGMDFQISPHMVAEVAEFFLDPDEPTNPLMWFTDAILVEGTEDDLIDALEARGYTSDRCAIVADASGAWQSGKRIKNSRSYEMLRKRGWTNIYRPDRKEKRNPEVIERVRAMNSRIRDSNGKRRLFGVPEVETSNTATSMWENRRGHPYRRSDYAHICDGRSYIVWRFHPRRYSRAKRFEVRTGKRSRGKREADLSGI